jgi:hypothetical protein
MKVCNDCGHKFEEPEFICERERIDYGIGAQWVTLWEGYVCPNCESNYFKEVEEEEA